MVCVEISVLLLKQCDVITYEKGGKHNLHGNNIRLNFINLNSNERCLTTDAPSRMSGTLFLNVS